MDTPVKVGLLAGGGVAAYLLYQWWRDQQEISANMDLAAVEGDQPPTQAQAVDPAFWERVARDVAAGIPAMGALPPWPGIGPRPHPRLGPVYSLTAYR
jgi:uncharacterized membrane protein YebE (DUF533 family)